MRRKAGVIAFGAKARLTEVFRAYEPSGFDRHAIEERRLHYDCPELGLLYHAILQGISNQTGLRRSLNAKGRFLFAPRIQTFQSDELALFRRLRSKGVWSLRQGVTLHEGIEVSLDLRDARFWMLIEPTIIATIDGQAPYRGHDRSDMVRETLVVRYNRQSNELLQMWIGLLRRHCGTPLRVAFPSNAEREAEFMISTTTAYARKA
jgi:hypothetical protein